MTAPLGLVVCGAPLAARAADVAAALDSEGWELAVSITAAGSEWLNPSQLTDAAIHRRLPDEQRRTPRPNRVAAFPLTFNTANKIAAGIMDNHVTGMLCDALGSGAPIVATLMVSDRLWSHPAWPATLRRLDDAGVRFLDPRTGLIGSPSPVRSGTGGEIVEAFDPSWVVNAVKSLPPTS